MGVREQPTLASISTEVVEASLKPEENDPTTKRSTSSVNCPINPDALVLQREDGVTQTEDEQLEMEMTSDAVVTMVCVHLVQTV